MFISREARVGIVVGLAVMTLTVAILFFRNVRAAVKEYEVTVLLDDAGGILKGADVYFAGVPVGTVREVDIDREREKAKLLLGIQSDINLLSNYEFAVRSGALLGDRYVVITPKSYQKGDTAIPLRNYTKEDWEKKPIIGRGPSSVEELLPKTQELMDNFSVLIGDLRGVVREVNLLAQDLRGSTTGLKTIMGDPVTQTAVKRTMVNLYQSSESMRRLAADPHLAGTLANVDRASQSLGQITKNANLLVQRTDNLMKNASELVGFVKDVTKTNEDNVNKTIAALPEMMKDLKDTTAELKRVMQNAGSAENLEQINATLKSVNKATENLAHITDNVQKLVGDPKTQDDIKQLLTNLNETTQSAKEAVKNLEQTSASLRELATNEQVKTDLKDTLHETKKTMASANELLQESKQAVTDGRQVISRVNKILGGGKEKKPGVKVQPELRFWNAPSSNRYMGDFDVWISPNPKKSFVLGLHDVTESDKLTAQYAPALGSLGYARFGFYRGKLGTGLDLLDGRGRLSLNVYDPNNFTGNVWGGYRLFRNWELMLGVEGLGQPRSQVGVGVRVMK
jgi:phospholipid/cholesterol/gamma-HCH transport system substrate-binding protein